MELYSHNKEDLDFINGLFGITTPCADKKKLSSIKIEKVTDDKKVLKILKTLKVTNLYELNRLKEDKIQKAKCLTDVNKKMILAFLRIFQTIGLKQVINTIESGQIVFSICKPKGNSPDHMLSGENVTTLID